MCGKQNAFANWQQFSDTEGAVLQSTGREQALRLNGAVPLHNTTLTLIKGVNQYAAKVN